MGAAAGEVMDIEELFKKVAEDERLGDMFQQAVVAAASSSSQERIRLLGRALATGALADDEASIDEAQELLRIAAELEAVDIRAMIALRIVDPKAPDRYRGTDPDAYLQRRLGMTPAVAATVLARLRQLGLLDETTMTWINDPQDSDDDSVNLEVTTHLSDAASELLAVLASHADPAD